MGLSASSRRSSKSTDTAPGTSTDCNDLETPSDIEHAGTPLQANAAVLSTPARRLLLEQELTLADRGGLAAAFTRDDLRAATRFERAALDRAQKGFTSSRRAAPMTASRWQSRTSSRSCPPAVLS